MTDRASGRWLPAALTGLGGWFAAIGTVVIALGFAVTLASNWRTASAGIVGFVGVIALAAGVYYAATYLRGRDRPDRTPTVASRPGVHQTGATLDERVRHAARGDGKHATRTRRNVESDLEDLAVDVLTAETDADESTARDRLTAGTWTDDAVAASLFSESETGSSGLTGDPDFETQVQRAVETLAEMALDDGRERRLAGGAGSEAGTAWTEGERSTGHWRGIGAFGLLALGAAAISQSTGLVLMAATLFGVAGYSRLSEPPAVSLAVEREFDAETPRPGDVVEVTVSVTNEGSSVLTDLRLVDAVPDRLAVVDGSPRLATALSPGESASISYGVLAVYGDHTFDAINVGVRDLSGQRERTSTHETEAATLVCEPSAVQQSIPLHPQTTGVTGRVPSDVGGSGQAFRSVREYRPGDPLGRVDWNRLARTGEFSTVEFDEERAATVVLLVETRLSAFAAPSRSDLSAVDRSLAAVTRVFETLSADGDRVGLASVRDDWSLIDPGAGKVHADSIRSALQQDPTFRPREWERGFEVGRYVRRLGRRLPADAQLILFSPLLDEQTVEMARRLVAHEYPLTVFSPDPTTPERVGATVARITRTDNVSALRAAGIRVVDWAADEPLDVALRRAGRRWNR